MAHHLPVVAHADVTAPADRVRCDRFGAVLTAEACAGRTLAMKLKPGHRRSGKVMTGVARYAPCAACALGAEARVRLAVKGTPGRPEDLRIERLNFEPDPEITRAPEQPLRAADEAFLTRQGWTRQGAHWLDQHGDAYRPEAALELAARDRVYVAQQGMLSRRRAA
ncbi:MAG: hypothetical protein Q8S73_36795 [Deltaproteobacteria bacterium]|nr:hypothetical protein [Myxococcales bacterium]MDP3219718.1 hypothetical protein [Deltaproteobacteria bacterium]